MAPSPGSLSARRVGLCLCLFHGGPAFAGHLSIPEVPAPSGLLSSPRGMDVSSLALVEIPIQLGVARVALLAREGQGRLPLFDYLFPLPL